MSQRRFIVLAALLFGWTAAARSDDDIAARLDTLRGELDPRASATLERILGLDRQLLAARAYLRAGEGLAARWSWTEAEIAAYAASPERARLDADLALVRCAFEQTNAGYSLYVNPEVRSLETQIERWNQNASVGLAAAALLDAVREATAAPEFASLDAPAAARALRTLLRDAVLAAPPNLAAPGLSLHGRMGAVDFQVQRDDRIVAGTEAAEIATTWDGQGWTSKLKAAVDSVQLGFEGPLRQPYEPWHYEYRAATVADSRKRALHACNRPEQ